MCGIAGVYHFARQSPVPDALVTGMCNDLLHRGPDDRGEHADLDGRVVLGHTRLSIIDLTTGHQPMTTRDGALAVSFNGEIYNHLELRDQLRDVEFATTSDTEVILHLYRRHGLDAFRMLRGMFAIALWDRRQRRLVLVRDRLGIKPLYYLVADGALAFASDVSPLLRVPRFSRHVSPAGLRYYLALRAIPAPLTMFQNVAKLPPGHLLVCDERGPGSMAPYWSLATSHPPERETDAHAAAGLRGRLLETVRAHMLSDVAVGAFLSGGLDSSLIVACMRQHTTGELHTFSVGSDDPEYSELPWARRAAEQLGTTHHEHVLKPAELIAFLPSMVRMFSDPVADPAAVPMYFIARLARRHGVKVVLSGEGSDELFAGYPAYLEHLGGTGPLAWVSRIEDLVRRRPPRRRYTGHAALGDVSILDRVLRAASPDSLPIVEAQRTVARDAGMDAMQVMLYLDLATRIPEDLLARTDRVTMANSVEARVPFLDHHLVEHALWLPTSLKVRNRAGKYVLRRAAEGLVPAEIIHRKKMGFPTPVRRWLASDLSRMFRHWLLDVREEPQLFDHAMLRRLVDEHFSGRRDWGLLLWRIWFFKVWSAHWILEAPVDLAMGLSHTLAREHEAAVAALEPTR